MNSNELREAVARILWDRFAPSHEEVFTGGGEYGLCASEILTLLDPAIAELVEGLSALGAIAVAYDTDAAAHGFKRPGDKFARAVPIGLLRRAAQLVAKYTEKV